LNYSEIIRSWARTKSLAVYPSLLWEFNSLFPKNFSLILDLKFSDNSPVSREIAPIAGENQFVAFLNTATHYELDTNIVTISKTNLI